MRHKTATPTFLTMPRRGNVGRGVPVMPASCVTSDSRTPRLPGGFVRESSLAVASAIATASSGPSTIDGCSTMRAGS